MFFSQILVTYLPEKKDKSHRQYNGNILIENPIQVYGKCLQDAK